MALTKASRTMLNTGISDSSDATALTFSSAEDATFAGHVILADNKYLKMGASNDLLITHDGSDSYIIDNGTGNLVVAGSAVYIKNAAYNEQMISAIQDAQVELYYNNSLKLATANDGIDVTGHIDATTITTTGAGTIGGNLTVTGNLQVDGTTTTINSTTYTVDDLNITLASGAGSSSAADGAGITIDGAAATWNYVHSNTSWVANKNVRAPRFLSTSNSSSNFYAVLATRSGSGTSNPDIYGSSNTLVLGYSDSGKAVHFNSTGADFAGTITSAGTIASGGNITAISASSPTLEIKDTTNNVQFKAYAQNSNAHLGTISNHALIIDTNNTAAISIDASQNTTLAGHLIVNGNTTLGNADTDTVTIPGPLAVDTDTLYVDVTNDRVGIGITDPAFPLEVFSGSSSIGLTEYNNGATIWMDGSNGDFAGGDYFGIHANGTTNLDFSYAGTNQVTILNTGRVGIGTTAPTYGLQINGGNYSGNALKTTRGTSEFYILNANDSYGVLGMESNDDLQIRTNATTKMTIKTDGKVGIGTTSPTVPLDVYNGSGWGGVDIDGTSGGELRLLKAGTMYGNLYASNSHGLVINAANGLADIILSSGGTAIMTLLDSGKVGIGTGSPPENLSVKAANSIIAAESTADNQRIGFQAKYIDHASLYGSFEYTTGDAQLWIDNNFTGNGTNYSDINIRNKDTSGNFQTVIKIKGGNAGNNGRVGINETSPDTLLHVDVNSASTGTDAISVANRGVTAVGQTTGMRFQYNTAVPAAIRANITSMSSGAGELGLYTSPDGTAGNLDKRLSVLTTETSRVVTQSLGGHSVGDGNTGDVGNPGVRVLGWYNANASNSSYSYLHLVTTLWGGGSPHGNSEYIMGGFRITAHQYATNASYGEAGIFFHNWNGSVGSGYSANYTGSYTNFCHVYVSSGGYVTLRLNSAAYKGYWIDLFQAGHYTTRNINVSAATFSSSATL